MEFLAKQLTKIIGTNYTYVYKVYFNSLEQLFYLKLIKLRYFGNFDVSSCTRRILFLKHIVYLDNIIQIKIFNLVFSLLIKHIIKIKI